nr:MULTISPECIES: hypothetical protein [unclassified Aeromonas]
MAKSKVQFQKGYSLFDFFKDYGTEAQCENALLAWEGALLLKSGNYLSSR